MFRVGDVVKVTGKRASCAQKCHGRQLCIWSINNDIGYASLSCGHNGGIWLDDITLVERSENASAVDFLDLVKKNEDSFYG